MIQLACLGLAAVIFGLLESVPHIRFLLLSRRSSLIAYAFRRKAFCLEDFQSDRRINGARVTIWIGKREAVALFRFTASVRRGTGNNLKWLGRLGIDIEIVTDIRRVGV